MRKVKILLLGILLGLSLISVVLFFRGGRIGYNVSRFIGSLPEHVDMRLSGVEYTEVTEGRREWTMKADTLCYFKGAKFMVFDRVRLTFFTNDGLVHVIGDKAHYDKGDKKFHLVGRVRAKDAKGYRLTTHELYYEVKTREMIAPGRFRIQGPDLNLDGRGLSVLMKDSRLKVMEQPNLLIKSAKNLF